MDNEMGNNEMMCKDFELTEENLMFVDGGTVQEYNSIGTPGAGQVPGMICPQCKNFIPTTIHAIINSKAIVCPHCHLRLNIDRTKSGKAIEALKKVQAAQDALEGKQ